MIPPRARARLGLAMGALVLAASAGCQGCHREIRFSPGGTDSTFVPADSLRGLFRNVLDLWGAVQELPLYEAALHLATTFGLRRNREEEPVGGTR